MTPQSELEIHGNFLENPFADLLAEIAQGRLDGSLRVSGKEKKCVIYFKGGSVVFAVSNARTSRLFDILLRRKKLTKEDLGQFPNFASDFELAAFLEKTDRFTKQECDGFFCEQIEEIIVDILSWTSGDWTFSSLARIREGLAFDVNITDLLLDHGRCVPDDTMLGLFPSLDETFVGSQLNATRLALTPEETFVLSRANVAPVTATHLINVDAMPKATALRLTYTLWLGGLLVRNQWQPAFSGPAVAAMKNAKLEIRKEAQSRPVATSDADDKVAEVSADGAISLEQYLERVEKAQTHYDILGVDAEAASDELKRAYFGLARMFHPDRYHSEGGVILRRVQNAFTELAQAHETLKNPESREVYDYRMRKEIADGEKPGGDSKTRGQAINFEQAAEHFERGFDLLDENEHEMALPFLARAVHFDPKNARYHAYYGKALSGDAKHRHKAEAELQAALKLDPNNATFRLLLAEFFIKFNLLKRAEGELTRLLALSPNNREARDLLAKLKESADSSLWA